MASGDTLSLSQSWDAVHIPAPCYTWADLCNNQFHGIYLHNGTSSHTQFCTWVYTQSCMLFHTSACNELVPRFCKLFHTPVCSELDTFLGTLFHTSAGILFCTRCGIWACKKVCGRRGRAHDKPERGRGKRGRAHGKPERGRGKKGRARGKKGLVRGRKGRELHIEQKLLARIGRAHV